jgi:hypothetical protein
MTESTPGYQPKHAVLRIVLIYAVFAALWILFSDAAVEVMFTKPAQLVRASMIKGWLFVAVTSIILYGLVSRMQANYSLPRNASRRRRQKRCAPCN